MTPTDCVRKALDLLCTRAGVNPADGSHEAGERVRAWYSRGWTDTGDAACPLDGPAGLWVRRVSGAEERGFRVYVGTDKVIITPRGHVPGTPRQEVALPPAVVAAVADPTATLAGRLRLALAGGPLGSAALAERCGGASVQHVREGGVRMEAAGVVRRLPPVRGGVGTPAFRWELARNKEAAA